MKKRIVFIGSMALVTLMVCVAFSAYHHQGEQDADRFLAVYPDMAGTKLDHCALCHSGGQYEKRPGKWVSLGSCQWCHYSYGYDGSGNIVDTLNTYGMDFLINGRNEAAIQAIENLDSDGDGYTNIQEIQAKRFPGTADDDPGKVTAPYKVYTRAELEAMNQHTQFMLMNTSRSGDFYAEYSGVPMEDLLQDAGMLSSATGITVYAPDGWSQYHPLEEDPDPELYHVGVYPEAVYQYDTQADTALNPVDGWCDYSAPSCQGRNHGDLIVNPNGNKMILANKREGISMDPGILNEDNKLDGEGPYRVVPPQKIPCPPDQSSKSDNQNVIWPYDYDWDHNAGAASRSATIIKVEPLPAGTTDIDILEAGWDYIDQGKIIIYGAIASLGLGNYNYYLPYFISDANFCTGLGLRNCSDTEDANVAVVVFDQEGNMISKKDLTLPARGQDSFLVGNGLSQAGWIKVNADQPLVGLCFTVKAGANNYMADITFTADLSTTLYVPHIAQDNTWDTTILICNPNNSQTIVNLKFVNSDGDERYSRNYTIPANGSGAYDLSELVQGSSQSQGSVEITATQGVAAFALFSNMKSGGMSYAGVSAMSPAE